MKKLSVSKALIGLFVVLAVGIGLAACYDGEYTWTGAELQSITDAKLTLSGGEKWEGSYKIGSTEYKANGTYKATTVAGYTFVTLTATGGDEGAKDFFEDVYTFSDGTLSSGSSSWKKKSVDGDEAEIEVILDDGLSAEELEALGL
ncbi:hypothetical protein FACS1894110_14660 [Spirochaetia bacterium]|nr:hypothetical protein FACS1894110_14660 [Spirochaetia bacterium]